MIFLQPLTLQNSEELSKHCGLNEKEIAELINFEKFNKAYDSLKSKIINKFACYILVFFPEQAKNKEDNIHNIVLKFLKEKQINKFYKIYEGNESEIENEK